MLQIGIILSSLGVLSLSAFNFLQIVELLNIIYCLAELMEFAAFIYLRYKAPDLVRYDLPLITSTPQVCIASKLSLRSETGSDDALLMSGCLSLSNEQQEQHKRSYNGCICGSLRFSMRARHFSVVLHCQVT